MSKATKRKHVARELLEEDVVPKESQQIVKVAAGRGNNLHEVETINGERFLASMPTKFRKNVWIKRGDFLIVEPIDEGDKVKAEIVHILYKHHIRHLKQIELWPKEFDDSAVMACSMERGDQRPHSHSGSDGDGESEDDDDLFVNTNRPNVMYESSTDSCSSNTGSDTEDENGEK